MDGEHPRVTAEHVRVARRTSQDLSPIGGEILDVTRAQAMGERVVELRILEAAFVGRGGQGEEGLFASGELVEGWTRPAGVWFSHLSLRSSKVAADEAESKRRRRRPFGARET